MAYYKVRPNLEPSQEAEHLQKPSLLTGKGPDPGKDWRQKEKGATKDEMVGWHHQLNEHKFDQTLLGVSEGQGRLAHSSPWGCKELDKT